MKLNVKAFGLACGILWGIGLFVLTWWFIVFDGPKELLQWMGYFYRGYSVSPGGSLIGLAWAFLDGLIGGALFAWLYNRIASCAFCASSSALGTGD